MHCIIVPNDSDRATMQCKPHLAAASPFRVIPAKTPKRSARFFPRSCQASMSQGKGVTLYTAGTPNGWKASIVLEELEIPYKVHTINMSKNEQKEEWFLKINPNGRIPAIVDHDEDDLPVFESGAIMLHLAEKDPAGTFLPKDVRKKAEVVSWLMFQMGGVGPMQGQANHFVRYAPEKIEYGMKRYTNETKRLYGVIEQHLSQGREWLAAGQYTIADMANFSWIFSHAWAGIEIDDMPHLQAWLKRIEERPAVKKGLDVPDTNPLKEMIQDPKKQQQAIENAQKMMVSHK